MKCSKNVKELVVSIIVLVFFACYQVASPNVLFLVKNKYPYSLIGDDFGILSEADLAANTCDVQPQPFAIGSESMYWQCFDSKVVKFLCDSNGTVDPHEGVMGLIVLSAHKKNTWHEYIARRPWQIADCRQFGRSFIKTIKGTHHVCIAGSSPENKGALSKSNTTTWIFEKYKSSKGCESYFYGNCDLTYLIRHGCKIEPAR